MTPRLNERHNAMLQAMGVGVWWATLGTKRAAPVPLRGAETAAGGNAEKPPVVRGVASVNTPLPSPPMAAAFDATPTNWSSKNATDWPAFAQAVTTCQACGLCAARAQPVLGQGHLASPDHGTHPSACEWLVLGDAPTEADEADGRPFAGREGQLMDAMLAALALTRDEQVYLTQAVKCRPPNNRIPQEDEWQRCLPYLRQQVQWLRPRVVLALGRTAVQAALALDEQRRYADRLTLPLGKWRGQVWPVEVAGQAYAVVASYAPGYLLRQPLDKAKAWEDLCLARARVVGLA